MSDIAIRVQNLSKLYRIGQRESYYTLRDTLVNAWKAPFRFFRANGDQRPSGSDSQFAVRNSQSDNSIWALKDVSFEVKRGEVVGIIGRNGAGKTTLLKILSRITKPTEGYAEVHGRVGTLLEVGTGFHPELTGRENIYLNGAILGIKKAKIQRKLDEIVAFAEVEKFVDTPVKHYSSGMYMRLAFAIAAHLEPEILLIDEVLAVGDAAFQKKCLGKMGDVAKEGRTVLFISHNMHAVSLLCPKAMLLQAGNIAIQGSTSQVITRYLSSEVNQSAEALWSFEEAPGTPIVKLRAVRVLNQDQKTSFDVEIDKPITLEMGFWILRKTRMTPSFHIYSHHGILLFAVGNLHDRIWAKIEYEPGLYRCSCTIPPNYLNEGQHYVTVYLTRDNNAGLIEIIQNEIVSFRVHDMGGSRGDFLHEWIGLVRPVLPWSGSRVGDLP